MKTVLDVKGLTVEFRTKDFLVSAVNSISFSIDEGKTLALVGESGSGKTVTALSILKLLPYQIASHSQGSSIKVNGREIMEMNPSEIDRKSTRLNSSHVVISYAVFCLKTKKKKKNKHTATKD